MSFACRLTGDREQAQDLLQDTTLKVLDNEDKFSENINFKGWAFTIMRNIFINNYRKSVRRNTIIDMSQDYYRLNACQESGIGSPEGSVSVAEIRHVIANISADYRVPFTLYVEGYKYAEIADRMHLPLGTVKSRIFFARRRIKEALGDYRY